MGKIATIIGQQHFELIRDRIGAVLALELDGQALLMGDDLFKADVWVSRMIPFDFVELPAINVFLIRGDYSSKDRLSALGEYVFGIDVTAAALTTQEISGDSLAASVAERITGMCRAILENPIYETLDFPAPFISTSAINSIVSADPTVSMSDNLGRLRIEWNVKVVEKVSGVPAAVLESAITGVKLSLTDKGFKYEIDSQ